MNHSIRQLTVYRFRIALVVILFGAAWLRLYDIAEVKNVDEPNIIHRAVSVANGQMHIHWYNWPGQSLIRIDGVVFKMVQMTRAVSNSDWRQPMTVLYQEQKNYFETIAHIVTVLFGLISITLVFFIAERLYSSFAGTLAALFLSVSYLHVRHSRFATPDVPMTTALLANILIALLLWNEQRAKRVQLLYLLAGIVVGFAIATKYTGALALIPIIFVHIIRFFEQYHWQWKKIIRSSWRLINLPVLLFFLGALAMHTVLNPFFFVDIQAILKQLLYEAQPIRMGVDWSGQKYIFLKNLLFYLRGPFAWSGTAITGIAYTTILYSLWRFHRTRWRPFTVLSIFFVMTLVGLSSLGLHWSRWAVPFSPLIAIAAGVGIAAIVVKIQQRCRQQFLVASITTFFLVMIIFPQALVSFVAVHSFEDQSTSRQMGKYIRQHLPTGSTIVADTYYLETGKDYRLETPRMKLYARLPEDYRQQGVDYLVIKTQRHSYARKQPELYPEILTFFDQLDYSAKKIVRVVPTDDSLLNHKRDIGVYTWLAQHGFSNLFSIENGGALTLYQLP
ncbi:MAG: glycosyltransferase family 39 protein [Candidatus Kerfeldbacteria bacterium]|nr:glycosyltransferase family 39 protein [Candidatus Kerfeldbacteria bacterium]